MNMLFVYLSGYKLFKHSRMSKFLVANLFTIDLGFAVLNSVNLRTKLIYF